MTAVRHLDPTDLDAVRRAVGLNDPSSPLGGIGIRRIVIGPDALDELPQLVGGVRQPGSIALVVDDTPMRRGPDDLKALVAACLAAVDPDIGINVVRLRAGHGGLHADAAAIAEVVAGAAGAGCVVALGSGTICDIAKEASRAIGAPFVVVQTANSVNAFSDDMAVLLINGVKRTMPSRWPDVLVIDLTVLADAPAALNRAGVGELAAMFTAPADWRLAEAFGMDPSWDRRVVDLFRNGATALLDAAPGATSDNVVAQRTLAELMTLSGLALGIAGKTSPISGTEHTVSHLLDMAAAGSGRPAGLHGAQVGVAALAVAVAWERLLATFDPRVLLSARPPAPAAMHERIVAAFRALDPSGAMAEECWSEYRQKLDHWNAARAGLPAVVERWPEIRADLASLLGRPAAIAGALRSAGASATFAEIDPAVARGDAEWALFNGHLIRNRFMLADLAWFAGEWTADAAAAAIDEAAAVALAAARPVSGAAS
ncbi:MAG: iron-containing alcohol dehydrogenase [Chloroflexi bacterium]|nr:iron-containing alcohol dehydrogenase [Chloroflexota bacterium]